MEARSIISKCSLKKLPKPIDLKNWKLEVLNSVFFFHRNLSEKRMSGWQNENFKPSTEIKYNAVNVDRETLSDAFWLAPWWRFWQHCTWKWSWCAAISFVAECSQFKLLEFLDIPALAYLSQHLVAAAA